MDREDSSGGIRRKLVESKERWAREGRLLTGRESRPELADWRLAVDGLVETPLELDWAAFLALPQTELATDIHCVTAWSRFDNRWTGVATRDLLGRACPKAEARFVVCHSHDGYTTNLPLDAFAAEDALVAHGWEGRPLAREHGGPARVVVPQLYFWKSAKWVRRIELVARDRPGFWEERGYHDNGDPWREERYR
ncbi:MAG: molybdopterin-binding oxidoreductase [Alphaproteobacteria bacterium]|nr:MAG: molybdopterin-binding oxidoreductase [Alphaproteobacteria bacterium]